MNKIRTIKKLFTDSSNVKSEFWNDTKNLKQINKAFDAIIYSIDDDGKLLVCGNGGSAADSQHMVAELVGRFEKEREALPAIALTTNSSIVTALSNDYDYTKCFVRQIEALADMKDVLFVISTSGNSENIIRAVEYANGFSRTTIGLLGNDGGKLASMVDIPIIVKSDNTARIQEVHITIIHIICKLIEDYFSE